MDTVFLEERSELKVTVTDKWYATICHPKMHPHTKFGIPTLNIIGNMAGTRIKQTYSSPNRNSTSRGLINNIKLLLQNISFPALKSNCLDHD